MQAQIGITIRASILDSEDLRQIHLPTPVLVGDVAAFEHGPPPEVIDVLHDEDGLPVAAKLRPVRLQAARR